MALLPSGPMALLALVTTLVGLALVLRRGIPKAYGLGLLMLAVFLLDLVGRLMGGAGTQGELGFRPSDLTWWSPLTSAFTHAPGGGRGGFLSIHLIGNLFILLTAGPALEERVGERKFLVIFFSAHLAALVSHVVLALATPLISLSTLALGASGGIFGVLTAFATRYPREKLPILLVFIVWWFQASLVLLIYLGFNAVYFLADYLNGGASGIGWWGHFAGFFVGLAFARTLPAVAATTEPSGSTRGLPDPEKLAPLATTPELREILDKARQFTPDTRTAHDGTFALAWIDKFLAKAKCAQGHAFTRDGLTARCAGGDTVLELAR